MFSVNIIVFLFFISIVSLIVYIYFLAHVSFFGILEEYVRSLVIFKKSHNDMQSLPELYLVSFDY